MDVKGENNKESTIDSESSALDVSKEINEPDNGKEPTNNHSEDGTNKSQSTTDEELPAIKIVPASSPPPRRRSESKGEKEESETEDTTTDNSDTSYDESERNKNKNGATGKTAN